MKKGKLKKILLVSSGTLVLLTAIVMLHIYLVMRPKAPDAHTRIMARIDIKEHINKEDANKITAWLYGHKGIDHVLCNPSSGIAVFTFAPLQTDANKIISDFKTSFPYHASRYMPSEEDMAQGCPVMGASTAYKLYKFMEHIF